MKHSKLMPILVIVTLLAVAFPSAFLSASPPQAGDRAPALELEKLLQAPEDAKTDWESLQGKIVVLDFWATWCGPCVISIPATNKLADAYKDKPVVFISITDEGASTIKAFLKKKPIQGWIGLDSDQSAFKAYGVTSRPTTVIVDQHGILVGKTSFAQLARQPDILDDLLAGKARRLDGMIEHRKLDLLRDLDGNIEDLAGSVDNRPLCLIAIRRSEPMRETFGGTSRQFILRAAPLRRVIARAYLVPEPYVTGSALRSDDETYDVIFIWPKGNLKTGEAILRQTIEATLGLRIRQVERTMDVYVLGLCEGVRPEWEPQATGMLFDPETRKAAPNREILNRMKAGDTFFGALGSSKNLAENLSYCLNRPVVDEAKIDGYYAFFFPYDYEKPDKVGLIDAVKTKYGLKLSLEERKISVVVAESTEGS